MRLIANSQLRGDYGRVGKDEAFDCPDGIAAQLLEQGKARKPDLPKIVKEVKKETKVISPPEVGPTVPFRNVSVPNPKPPAVVEESDKVLSKPDVSKPGTTRAGRRRLLRGLRKRIK